MNAFMTPEDHASAADQVRPTVRAIIKEVSAKTAIPELAILGRNRQPEVARARELVCFIAHRNGMTFSQIGRALGRDHTTIFHAVRNEKRRREISTEPKL